ncbi:MAG: DinB family protein [Acidobacteriota bacterium]
MSNTAPANLLDAVLDSWDRNNRIAANLLRAIPAGGMNVRAMETSPSVAEMFAHIIYVRLVFVVEAAPEGAGREDPEKWLNVSDPERLAPGLETSARCVRDAVEDHLRSGKPLQQHYDHPLLFLQHMIWHEGYHHGQIKLALKTAGLALDDEQIGPLTWDIWIEKNPL